MKAAGAIAAVRTNINFDVAEDNTLKPKVELIILAQYPAYKEAKDSFKRVSEVADLRFFCNRDAVTELIGQLQLVLQNLTQFEQSAAAINTILKHAADLKKDKDGK